MAKNQVPTLKQIKTLQYMNQGMTVHRAMKEAGYSKASLVTSSKFKKSPVVQKMMSGLKSKLVDKGFTVDFLADKFMEWINAEKPISGMKITIGKDAPKDMKFEPLREPD